MTQIWDKDKVLAVTKVQAGPCTVTQVKNRDKDGYSAVQLGFGARKEKNINKAQQGHTKGLGNFQCMREFRVEDEAPEKGSVISVETFEKGDVVDVISTSKGKGFQGVVKRYGFKGSKKTHGNKDQLRMPGSIGATGPAHVFKGTRMGGRMGGDRVTIKNQTIAGIDVENGIVLIYGNVPGARNSVVLISAEGELKYSKPEAKEPSVAKAVDGKDEDMKEEKASEAKKEEKTPEVKEEPKKDEKIEEVVVEAKEKKDKKDNSK